MAGMRRWGRALCSPGGLLLGVALYVGLGALLFHHLEAGPELQRRAGVRHSRDDCLRELWLITERLNVLYERNWTRLVHAQLRRFERAVVAGARADREPQWGLPGSLLYALTLVTTVGWGSAAPRTAAGKAAGMLYALLGAPLLLLWLAAAGGLLARAARRAAARCQKHQHHQMDNHFQLHEQHALLGSSSQQCGTLPRSSHHAGQTSLSHNQMVLAHGTHGTHGAHASQSGHGAHGHGHGQLALVPHGHAHAQHIVHAAGARYSHVFQRASPSRAGTLARGKQTPHSASLECLDESQVTATTSASGTPRRCCGAPPSPRVPSLVPATPVDLNAVDDARDSEESDGECMCSHDTPSRVPLIWRQQGSGAASSTSQPPATPRPLAAVPAPLVLLTLAAYLVAGAALFSLWEGWSFLDAVYFCFITISTIGFGDFAPGQNGSKLSTSDTSKNEHLHLFACCAYLIFGLVLVAMSFSLVQEEVTAKCSQIANALGLVRH